MSSCEGRATGRSPEAEGLDQPDRHLPVVGNDHMADGVIIHGPRSNLLVEASHHAGVGLRLVDAVRPFAALGLEVSAANSRKPNIRYATSAIRRRPLTLTDRGLMIGAIARARVGILS
jgi:hypothetical protein